MFLVRDWYCLGIYVFNCVLCVVGWGYWCLQLVCCEYLSLFTLITLLLAVCGVWFSLVCFVCFVYYSFWVDCFCLVGIAWCWICCFDARFAFCCTLCLLCLLRFVFDFVFRGVWDNCLRVVGFKMLTLLILLIR